MLKHIIVIMNFNADVVNEIGALFRSNTGWRSISEKTGLFAMKAHVDKIPSTRTLSLGMIGAEYFLALERLG
jgi:hypothetical protein